jgi:hypothetical protein
MEDPAKLDGSKRFLSAGLRNGWKRLSPQRRALLQLLSRCAISEDQAFRLYDTTACADAEFGASDAEILANPYLLFERDRRSADRAAFGTVDRGLFPDESIRDHFPIPEPSRITDPADPRRVRALVVDLLEEGAAQGHTLLPRKLGYPSRPGAGIATAVSARQERTRCGG